MKILKEDYDRYSRVIRTGLTHKLDKQVLDGVMGQLSDGMWENSPAMKKFWNTAQIDFENGEVVIKINNNGYLTQKYNNYTGRTRDTYQWSPWSGKSDDEIKKWFANKVKQVVKAEIDDGRSDLTWDRNNNADVDYLHDGARVSDAYRVYDKLMGRVSRSEAPTHIDLKLITEMQPGDNVDGKKIVSIEPDDERGVFFKVEFEDGTVGKFSKYTKLRTIVENMNEAKCVKEDIDEGTLSTAGPIEYAVKLLYEMNKFVLDVYDNENWLMNGVPNGEFEETTAEEAMKNYTEHDWLITDMESGKLSAEDFSEFVNTFKSVTRNKNYDQEERARIIAEAEDLLKEYSTKIDECDKLEENADEDHAYSKEEVIAQLEQELPDLGNNGTIKYGFKSEAEAAEEFLSNHYAHVELDKVGSWFQIDYAELLNNIINESKTLHEGRPLVVDTEGLKRSMRPLCDRLIKELGLPIDSFTLSNGSLEKHTNPVYYTFTFNIHLRGDIKPIYNSKQNEDGVINLEIILWHIPTNVEITPELLYDENAESVIRYMRNELFTDSEQDNYREIYKDKLDKITNICNEIGNKYSIKLEPSFYPSIERLGGSPNERITLYIKPVSIEGKLGDFQPSKIRSGYLDYTVDNVSYSSELSYADHVFNVPAADFKPVDYELDYNQIRDQIESHIKTLMQQIDEVDHRIKLHSDAEKELELQLKTINAELGSNVLTKGAESKLGFSIVCDINGKTFKDHATEEETLDPNFWKHYKRKVQRRMRPRNTSRDNSYANNSVSIDFDEE